MADGFDTPESVAEALTGPEIEKWEEESIAKEAVHFISKKGGKKVPKKAQHQTKPKIMKTKTILKKKHDANKEIGFKMRMCSKGFFQTLLGVDFKEPFSPVARETSVRVILCEFYLHYADGHDGLVYKIEAIDIEVAFLEVDIMILWTMNSDLSYQEKVMHNVFLSC
jgi:hypothetical protein